VESFISGRDRHHAVIGGEGNGGVAARVLMSLRPRPRA
jgi:hypothetical protein